MKQPCIVEKANMMLRTREATEKDRRLKTQIILSSANQNEKVSNKCVWQKSGFFSDEKADFNIIYIFF